MQSGLNQVLNQERLQALGCWLENTKIKLTQVNGQRKYGGPPEEWDGPIPGPRCEVFISQIPRDAYEDLLIPLFSSVGPLWEFRLMMNFSGQNRGFAYAKYSSSATAAEAIRLLNGYVLEPGFHLSVRRSTEKKHLCIGDLPASTNEEDLLQVLQKLVDGVDRVSLKAGPGVSGTLAVVAFSSHHTASMAKKVLVEAFKKLFSWNVIIKWQVLKPKEEQPSSHKSSQKPQHRLVNTPQPSHLLHPLATPAAFCKTVGGPTAPQAPLCCASTSSSLLGEVDEVFGANQPLYEINYSHVGADGFLYFTYKVSLPGLIPALAGWDMILPGPSVSSTLDEARRAVARRVLQAICAAGSR